MGRGGLGHDPTAVGMGPCAEPYAQRTVLVASERFEFFVETEAAGRGATINVDSFSEADDDGDASGDASEDASGDESGDESDDDASKRYHAERRAARRALTPSALGRESGDDHEAPCRRAAGVRPHRSACTAWARSRG